MKLKSLFVDTSLLRRNRHFLNVFIARTLSLLGLGLLSVAIPLQVYRLSGDSLHVGLAMALEGAGLFVGLLLGGVLADRWDRRKLILFARATCGLGFLGLAVNAWLPTPQLWAIYALSIWDGFFGALGVTALLSSMPAIVGRENLMQARALSMVSMRFATVLSPALGGALIAAAGIGWSYLLTAAATGLTLLPLLSLPSLQPVGADEDEHPLRALADGFRYLFTNKIVLGTVVVGTLVTLVTAIRVLFPALIDSAYGGGAGKLGLMYSAVSLGATLAMLFSGWAQQLRRPGLLMQALGLAAFAGLMLLGINTNFIVALILLASFGYLVSVASLLQYTLVQSHTPDRYLGRVNALWTAQDASGDSLGTLGIGLIGKLLSASAGIFTLGAAGFAVGVALLGLFKSLRKAPLDAAGEQVVSKGSRVANAA